jgi:DNA-binding GntR family transcriptional regulator
VARSSLVIALYGRTGASSCGHSDHERILAALVDGDGARAGQLAVHHIDHIEADLDLRDTRGLPLREALAP